jgi:hypothetical protein
MAFWFKRGKMIFSRTKEAGSQCTLNKTIFCPNNGETLKGPLYYPQKSRRNQIIVTQV